MKNITKILLALMLCLAVVFATVACNEEKKDEGGNGDPAKEATEAVENFAEAFLDLDFDKAQEYLLDADGAWDGIDKDYMIEKIMETMPEELGDYEKDVEKIFENVYDDLLGKVSIEVIGTEVKSDTEVVVKVEIKVPDMERPSIDFNVVGQEIVVKLYNEGKIDQSMSEEEIVEVMMPEVLDYIAEEFEKAVDEADIEEKKKEFTVVKKDGKWLLEHDGDLEDLVDSLDI